MKISNKQVRNSFLFWLSWFAPIFFTIVIYALSFFPFFVEYYYSSFIYLFIADIQRVVVGWIPFSVGDIFYGWLLIYLIIWLVKILKFIVQKKITCLIVGLRCLKLFKIILWIYIVFNVLWGLNYSRLGIAYQLKLKEDKYATLDLRNLTCDILDKLNDSRIQLGDSNFQYPTNKVTFKNGYNAYQQTKTSFSFLNYQHFSVKPSLLSNMVSYAGYSGYYNPFSGEAQLNNDLPKFILPFVTCHEMAHQLGYASESEANFVGYLAATHSNNPLFIYSAYFDVFLSANGELLNKDFRSAYLNLLQLNSLVKKDKRTYREYVLGKKNNMQPIMYNFYDQYLKANQQKNGIESYNEVVGWLIAYKKKYGKI